MFWASHKAHRILVFPPGIEPIDSAMEVQDLNHWTASEVLKAYFKYESKKECLRI